MAPCLFPLFMTFCVHLRTWYTASFRNEDHVPFWIWGCINEQVFFWLLDRFTYFVQNRTCFFLRSMLTAQMKHVVYVGFYEIYCSPGSGICHLWRILYLSSDSASFILYTRNKHWRQPVNLKIFSLLLLSIPIKEVAESPWHSLIGLLNISKDLVVGWFNLRALVVC